MFRAKRKDGQGEVKGWLNYDKVNDRYFIVDEFYYTYDYDCWLPNIIEVIPSTISMKTYQLDKAKEMIYGSFDLEGFGMTKGGDVVSVYYDGDYKFESEVFYNDGGFNVKITDIYESFIGEQELYLKIIGKQYDEEV